MTVKAVALGLLLAFVFGAANAYLGMRAGQTVAATIPAAVIAMALFRLPVRGLRGGILEQNIARTAASVGEALVAGAIFTIPAFVLVEIDGIRLWSDLRAHYWEATFILLAGGLIGVFFIILLRRPLCVDAGLPWPESVASVEIVKAGDRSGAASRYIFGAMGFGGLIQILKSDKGFQIFRDYLDGFWRFPRSVVRHFDFEKNPIGEVAHTGGVAWSTPSLSPALLGIGYIIGPRWPPSISRAASSPGGCSSRFCSSSTPICPRGSATPRRTSRPTRSGTTWCGPWPWAPCWWRRFTRCSRCAPPSSVR
jgi:uncharacterized oligopeptide transporter (OPT) family protein